MASVERTPLEQLQLELAAARSEVARLQYQNTNLRNKLAYVAAYNDVSPLPAQTEF